MGLLDVESFQNTKESFAFGKYAHLSEEVLDEELRQFMRATEHLAECIDGA